MDETLLKRDSLHKKSHVEIVKIEIEMLKKKKRVEICLLLPSPGMVSEIRAFWKDLVTNDQQHFLGKNSKLWSLHKCLHKPIFIAKFGKLPSVSLSCEEYAISASSTLTSKEARPLSLESVTLTFFLDEMLEDVCQVFVLAEVVHCSRRVGQHQARVAVGCVPPVRPPLSKNTK